MRWFDFRNPLSLEPLVAETIPRAFCIGYRGMLDFEVGSLGVDVPCNHGMLLEENCFGSPTQRFRFRIENFL